MFSNRCAFNGFQCWCYPSFCGIFFHTIEKLICNGSIMYGNTSTCSCLVWSIYWHFKVLVESNALTWQVSQTVMTFAADKCWISEEDCETADWHCKLTAAGRKHFLMKKLSWQSGKSATKVMYSPSLLTLFDWLWNFIFLFTRFSSNPFEVRCVSVLNSCLCVTQRAYS